MTDILPCTQCGKPHVAYDGQPGCKGHKSGQPDEPCTKRSMKGSTVCRNHGGALPQVRKAAASRLATQRAEQIMATLGAHPTDTDPVEGLHLVICWSRTHMDWLRERVQELLPSALTWGDYQVVESQLRGMEIKQRAQVNAWLDLYYRERQFFTDACAKAIHAGLAEREVRLEEQRGALIADVIRRVLSDLELTPDQQSRALTAVPFRLREAQQGSQN